MKKEPASLPLWLAKRQTRAWIHAGILLAGAGALLGLLPTWRIAPESGGPDALKHYRAGQIITGCVFYLAYFGIVLRVLLVGRGRGSMTRVLLWIPSMLAAGGIAAVAAALLFSAGKELLDWGGLGRVEWFDLRAGLDGALSMLPAVAVIMAVTPLFIPLDILLQIPRLMLADVKTGIRSLDEYAREQKSHTRRAGTTDVLVVEDDISCAATAMHFFGAFGWKCRHVSTIAEADAFLRAHTTTLRVVLLDIFVRVGKGGDNRTGSQWLTEIASEFPAEKRGFLIVVVSGHTELLGKASGGADLVLQKPWDPRRLADFLQERFPGAGFERA
ncbi:MAG TPA: hypothetical protein PLI51_01510 [bacterium]|nr:hypothetical protein [bacterium]HPQ65391.1 hypothetical protein [bacterium]